MFNLRLVLDPPSRDAATATSASEVTTLWCCLVWRCELGDCSERVQTSNFLSWVVGNPIDTAEADATQTRQFLLCLAWRCELALREWQTINSGASDKTQTVVAYASCVSSTFRLCGRAFKCQPKLVATCAREGYYTPMTENRCLRWVRRCEGGKGGLSCMPLPRHLSNFHSYLIVKVCAGLQAGRKQCRCLQDSTVTGKLVSGIHKVV